MVASNPIPKKIKTSVPGDMRCILGDVIVVVDLE